MSGNDVTQAIELIRQFVRHRTSAEEFVPAYMEAWKRLRDAHALEKVNPYVRRALNVVFEAADSVDDPVGGRSLSSHAVELHVRVATVLSVIDNVS
jgi:hypothetical protein